MVAAVLAGEGAGAPRRGPGKTSHPLHSESFSGVMYNGVHNRHNSCSQQVLNPHDFDILSIDLIFEKSIKNDPK